MNVTSSRGRRGRGSPWNALPTSRHRKLTSAAISPNVRPSLVTHSPWPGIRPSSQLARPFPGQALTCSHSSCCRVTGPLPKGVRAAASN